MNRLTDIAGVFRIQLASMRREIGPFLLAAIVFPAAMYLFANAVSGAEAVQNRVRFLAASITFSLSLTSISWLGYLLLENRFTGRLKLFATLPIAPSSYVFGVVSFALAQAVLGTTTLLIVGKLSGADMQPKIFLLFAVVFLAILSLCGLGVIIAARARSFSEGSLLTDALGAGLVLLAPIYYAPEMTPTALRMVTKFLPTTMAARAIQTTLAGGHAIGIQMLTLGITAFVVLGFGFRVMRWREE